MAREEGRLVTPLIEFEPGDAVWYGNGKVHWIIVDMAHGTHEDIVLQSGQTGRLMYRSQEAVEKLRMHTKGPGYYVRS